MSINLKGKLPANIESSVVPIHNEEPTYGTVLVTIHGDVNRDTDAKLIGRYLKNGWDWNLFSPIAIAVFPPDSGIEPKLLDGDHRRHMFSRAFPDRTHIPALIYKVADMDEYHRLFTKLNLYNRKSATMEEVFVHDVLSRQPKAIATQKI